MKKLLIALCLLASPIMAATNFVFHDGTSLVTYSNTNKTTNVLFKSSDIITNNTSSNLNFTGQITMLPAELTNSPVTLDQMVDYLGSLSVVTLHGSTNDNFWGDPGALQAEPDVTNYSITNTFSGSSNILSQFWTTQAFDKVSSGNYVSRWYAKKSGTRTITGKVRVLTRLNGAAAVTQGVSAASSAYGTAIEQLRVTTYATNTVVGTQVVFGVEFEQTSTGGGGNTDVEVYFGTPYSPHIETPGLGTTFLGVRGATGGVFVATNTITYSNDTRLLYVGSLPDAARNVANHTNWNMPTNINLAGYTISNGTFTGNGGGLTNVSAVAGWSEANTNYSRNAANLTNLSARTNAMVGFVARRSYNQTNATASTYYVSKFDNEIYDSGTTYNTGTYKFTAPVTGRYYIYVFDLLSPLDDTSLALATIEKITGGVAPTSTVAYVDITSPRANANVDLFRCTIQSLNSGDVIYFQCYDSNAARDTAFASGIYSEVGAFLLDTIWGPIP